MALQAEAFLALVDEGRRPASGLGPDALWEQLLRWPRPPERPEPWPLLTRVAGARAPWELAPAAGDVAAIVIVGPPDEPPEAVLGGLRGASWRAAAELAGWTVLALPAPFAPGEVAELAGRLAEERGIGRVVLVAVGPSVDAALAHAAALEEGGVGRLVLLGALGTHAGRRPAPPEGLALPTLLVDAEAELEGREVLRGGEPGRRRSFVWRRRVEPLVVVELELPWLVAEWLGEERPAAEQARDSRGSEHPPR
jgi:hypothetical protein